MRDNNVRKFKCFVCGRDHADFDSFKSHVLNEHEEGREYVICPLARCQAPVRDLNMHFKAKHPNDHLPKEKQQRAMIWKDIDQRSGKMKTQRPKYREGNYVSNKNGGVELHYRSGFECEVYECLEALTEVYKFKAEPFAVPYLFEGSMHNYYPDIQIHWSDGKIEVWEVKPSKQTSLPRNEAKWAAAAKYCKARGWEFIVLTEEGLKQLRRRVWNMRRPT